MMAAKASFISAQGTKITLAWYAGNDYSQGWVQSTSDLQRLPFTNVFSFGMNAQQVTNTFLSTTPQRFFRLSWVKQTNQFE